MTLLSAFAPSTMHSRQNFEPSPRRRPGRQFDLTPVVAAHARPMHGDLAAVEADLAFGRAPAVADAVLAAAIRGSGELLRIITEHLLDRADAGRQTEPLEGPIHILPSRLEAGHERERWGRGSAGHGVALLCGFVTPSLTAQGGQRLPTHVHHSSDHPSLRP